MCHGGSSDWLARGDRVVAPFVVDPGWYGSYWYAPEAARQRTHHLTTAIRRVMAAIANATGALAAAVFAEARKL
jgi:hypothetical protein